MRRIPVIFTLLALFGAGALLADAEANAEACSAVIPGAELAAQWSQELAKPEPVAGDAGARAEAGHKPLPPCPVESDCTGPAGNGNTCSTNPANCGAGPGQRTDTGWSACSQGGSFFSCPLGKTIVIKSANCSQCRCCSQLPACLCPIDCGSVLRWGCD